jgi:hypothetical protein
VTCNSSGSVGIWTSVFIVFVFLGTSSAMASELYLQCDLHTQNNSNGVSINESHQYYFEDPDHSRAYLDKQWDGYKSEWGTASKSELYEETASTLTIGWIKGDRPYNFMQHMMTIDRNTGSVKGSMEGADGKNFKIYETTVGECTEIDAWPKRKF